MPSPLQIGIVAPESSLSLLMESLQSALSDSPEHQQLMPLISFVPCELSRPGAPAIITESFALLIGAPIESEKDGAAVASMLRTLRRFRPDKKALLAVALWGERAENFAEQASHLNVILPAPEARNLPPGSELRARLLETLRPQLLEILAASADSTDTAAPTSAAISSAPIASHSLENNILTDDFPVDDSPVPPQTEAAPEFESELPAATVAPVSSPVTAPADPAPVIPPAKVPMKPSDEEALEFLTEDFVFSEELQSDPASVSPIIQETPAALAEAASADGELPADDVLMETSSAAPAITPDVPAALPLRAASENEAMRKEEQFIAPGSGNDKLDEQALLDLEVEDAFSVITDPSASPSAPVSFHPSSASIADPDNATNVFGLSAPSQPEIIRAPQEKLQDDSARINDLEQALRARDAQIEELQAEIADIVDIQRETLQRMTREHQDQLAAHNGTVQQLTAQLSSATAEHAEAMKTVKSEFEGLLRDRDAHLQLLEEELKSLHAAAACASAAEEHIHRLEAENQMLLEKLKASASSEKEMMATASAKFSSQMEEAVNAERMENQKLTMQLAEAVKAELETSAEVERLREQMDELLSRMQKAEATLENERSTSAAQMRELEARTEQFETCALELEERAANLEMQNSQFEAELAVMKQRAEAAEEQIQTADERAKFAEAKAEDFFQQVVRERKQQKALKAQLQSLEATTQQLLADNSRVADELSRLPQAHQVVPGTELSQPPVNLSGKSAFHALVADLKDGKA